MEQKFAIANLNQLNLPEPPSAISPTTKSIEFNGRTTNRAIVPISNALHQFATLVLEIFRRNITLNLLALHLNWFRASSNARARDGRCAPYFWPNPPHERSAT